MWQLIIDRVNSLSRRFKDARTRYRKVHYSSQRLFQSACYVINNSCLQTLYGTTAEDAWWRECVRYVQGSMENAVGALYVRETFAGESKQMVSNYWDILGRRSTQMLLRNPRQPQRWFGAGSPTRENKLPFHDHLHLPRGRQIVGSDSSISSLFPPRALR